MYVARNFWRTPGPIPLFKHGHLEQATQDHFQSSLKYLQWWRFHTLFRHPLAVFHNYLKKLKSYFLVCLYMQFSIFQLMPTDCFFCCVWALFTEAWLHILCHHVFMHTSEPFSGRTVQTSKVYVKGTFLCNHIEATLAVTNTPPEMGMKLLCSSWLLGAAGQCYTWLPTHTTQRGFAYWLNPRFPIGFPQFL